MTPFELITTIIISNINIQLFIYLFIYLFICEV